MATTRDPAGPPAVLSFWKRLLLAIRVLFDPALAWRLLPEAAPSALPPGPPETRPPEPDTREADRADGALTLLALLQAEGRLVDFLQQEVASFPDSDIGAAARVVHAGCRKALLSHVELVRVRGEPEGAAVTLEPGFAAASIRLTGDVRGQPPYHGVLRHGGWRAGALRLPVSVAGHDVHVLAAAEVEL